MGQEMESAGENSVAAWYREEFKKPLEEIYEDIFFRMDNFEGEEWYGDIEIYAGIGVCQPKQEHLETVQKALKILGYETHAINRDGKCYLLPGEYCDKEKLIARSEKLLKETKQYKELEGSGEENYEITCILVKGSLERPEDVIAYAEQADNYLILNPLGKPQEAEQSWGFHFDSEVFFPLEKGYSIIFMTAERHYDMWTMLGEFKEEKVLNKQGFRKYLEYCKENMVTKDYLQKETSYFGADLETLYRQKVKITEIGKGAR